MSLADACLVRLSELHKESTVFTLDSDALTVAGDKVSGPMAATLTDERVLP